MRKSISITVMSLFSLLVAVVMGCTDGVFTGGKSDNQAPEVWLSSGPVQGDTTGYQVHFYWSGWDPDGEISHFEFCIVTGGESGIGFNPADTSGSDKWTTSTAHDSIFRVAADENPRPYDPENPNSIYTRYDKTHTLFMRAVDLEGKVSEVVYRSFTAWTIAPIVFIDHPPGGTTTYSTVITFRWSARDPIDSPANSQDPDSIRYFVSLILNKEGIYQPDFLIIDDLNENPQDYEDKWGNWIHYRASGDSGRSTKWGDDEVLELNRSHIFAVQAKDEAGAVTAIFERDTNVKQFVVSWKQGPLMTVTENFLGGFRFLGLTTNPVQKRLPPGIPLNFCWHATADDYGGEIVGYRYGWDIQDLSDPKQWATLFSPFVTCAQERTLYSGSHTLYIEAIDDGNRITRATIEIEVIQFTMDRTILWVDDLASSEAPNPLRTMPLESEHDAFWTGICQRVPGFQLDRDVYDVQSRNLVPPDIALIGRYSNIIWTYGSVGTTAWRQIIPFTPESMVGQSGQIAINYISLFLAKGGHLLTEGRSDGYGGLISAFLSMPQIPAVFKFDMSEVDPDDTSGVYSMPYKDYCASVVDKVLGSFWTGEDMAPGVTRNVDRDAMRFALKAINDPVVVENLSTLPDSMRLWSGITCTSCFFNPSVRGFTYVEVYDPQYWLDFKLIPERQQCFHPIYLMKARNAVSPIHDEAVALVLTKYRDQFYGREDLDFIPAYSFHFGYPLWFFNRHDVDRVITTIFNEWQVLE